MKVAVVGKIKNDTNRLKKSLKQLGYTISKNPDYVISFGGDGSFLFGERKYPGIPKVMIREKSLCLKCNEGRLDFLLKRLVENDYQCEKHHKLEAEISSGKKKIRKVAANDIVIRNKNIYEGLRFSIIFPGHKLKNYIGDGIVAATEFGSSAYFHSITKQSFKTGFGLAFNNITTTESPVIKDNLSFTFKVERNDAVLSVDDDKKVVVLKKGDTVKIKKSKDVFKLIKF